jgi:DNA-binding CsgD family transcriptional regulator
MLDDADVRAAERLAADMAAADDLDAWARVAVHGLLDLIPTDHSHVFSELRQEPFEQGIRVDAPHTPHRPDLDEAMARYWRQSPTSSARVGSDGGVFRWSDLMARDELEHLEIFQEAFHPRGEDYVAKVAFPSKPLESHALMLHRTGADFDHHEVGLLHVLYPALRETRGALVERAKTRALEDVLLAEGIGVIQLRRGATAFELLGGADWILHDWFGRVDPRLPSPVASWVEAQLRARPLHPGQPLVLRRGDRTLVVRFLRGAQPAEPDQLLLRDRRALGTDEVPRSLGLTLREIDVLKLVAQGMTNREVAGPLCLAVTTVRRHLENIFAKIGVRTRTAAVAKAFPHPEEPSSPAHDRTKSIDR